MFWSEFSRRQSRVKQKTPDFATNEKHSSERAKAAQKLKWNAGPTANYPDKLEENWENSSGCAMRRALHMEILETKGFVWLGRVIYLVKWCAHINWVENAAVKSGLNMGA